MKTLDLKGRRFGLLVAKSVEHKRNASGRPLRLWVCRCDCGQTVAVPTNGLTRGDHKSCGCQQFSGLSQTKHGHAGKKNRRSEYKIWCSMKDRCLNPSNKYYAYYGGRGITVCDEWATDYESFYRSVGRRPSPSHSLDRIDNNGNYEPGNVRWATKSEQALNRRKGKRRHKVKYQGRSLREQALEKGLLPDTVLARYRRGERGESLFAKNLHGRHNYKRKGVPRPDLVRDPDTGRFVGSRRDTKYPNYFQRVFKKRET